MVQCPGGPVVQCAGGPVIRSRSCPITPASPQESSLIQANPAKKNFSKSPVLCAETINSSIHQNYEPQTPARPPEGTPQGSKAPGASEPHGKNFNRKTH
jgi:hypothetical protein